MPPGQLVILLEPILEAGPVQLYRLVQLLRRAAANPQGLWAGLKEIEWERLQAVLAKPKELTTTPRGTGELLFDVVSAWLGGEALAAFKESELGVKLAAGLKGKPAPPAFTRSLETREPIPTGVPEAPVQPVETGPSPAPRAPTRPALPAYDGKITHGILITNEGDTVYFTSGDTDPLYKNYPNAGHVEGKAALYIRTNNSTGGVLFHNNIDGTCSYCDTMTETLLPEEAQLDVYPPENAMAKKRGAQASPTSYKGNNKTPGVTHPKCLSIENQRFTTGALLWRLLQMPHFQR